MYINLRRSNKHKRKLSNRDNATLTKEEAKTTAS